MKILFDHCVPKPLARAFLSHEVQTTAQMQWEKLQNGKLLVEAAAVFEVFLTVDKNLKFQQNLNSLPIAVVILDAPQTTPEALLPFAPFVELILPTLKAGQLVEIDETGKTTVIAPGREP